MGQNLRKGNNKTNEIEIKWLIFIFVTNSKIFIYCKYK